MRKVMLVIGAAALSALPVTAFAANNAVTGAAGGAVTGAIVGGPVGAAVGGVAGAIAGGAMTPPPPDVVTYVQQQPVPANPVVVQKNVVVGQPLPSQVTVTPVPQHPKYAYAVVNHERVIVDPQTHTVVKVVK
ncbi:MAG TPA: DUF1236 domain-containing protein [Gammaproteobacteria bacterium]|nr:DUF1236 domain-containing protein [Gammaproteobacteria bacterium]